MTRWEDRPARALALREVEDQLRQAPDSPSLLFKKGVLLDDLNDVDGAKDAYIATLRRDENHFGAMNNLGTLLCRLGHQELGLPIYAEAVKRYPAEPISRINFANGLAYLGQFAAAREHYEAAVAVAPDNRVAHQGLGNVLSALGEEEGAKHHWRLAFTGNALAVSPYFGEKPPIRTLVLYSQTDGNIPLDDVLDSRIFQRLKLTVEYFDESQELPAHDIVFNAVGDIERCQAALESAMNVARRSRQPVLNHPSGVLQTSRAQIAQRLAAIPGVVTARTMSFARAALDVPEAAQVLERNGFAFPLLLRSPGYHTGQHLVKVDQIEDLSGALRELPGDEILVMAYLDARSRDGKFRKYRVMFIDGELYPLHVAVSSHWKVHYFSADMSANAGYRNEDEAFLRDMRGVLGASAGEALEAIQTTLGLDYGGIDFALDDSGRVLVFEANATMRVPRTPGDTRWDYRRAPVKKIGDAIVAMLAKRAAIAD
jgi:hypothetical protein